MQLFGEHRVKRALLLAAAVTAASWAQPVPTVSSVLNTASNDAAISPGCWVTVTGTGLATSTNSPDSAPLPTVLDGVAVTVNGVPGDLLYVSPEQIKLVIPADIQE